MAGYAQAGTESHLDLGAIIGMNGAKWTTDAAPRGLKITQEQATVIGGVFTNKDFSPFQSGGIKIADVQYMFLRTDDGENGVTVFGKKKDKGSIVLQSTKTAIVIGHCPEGKQQGTCSVAVGKICDYLANMGM